MKGRLLPICGGSDSPLTFEEVTKAAQAQAHRETSVTILQQVMAGLVKKAEGEMANALRGTLASFAGPEAALQDAKETENSQVVPGTSPDMSSTSISPPGPLRSQDEPVASMGLNEGSEKLSAILSTIFSGELNNLSELEKKAFLGRLLASGRGAAAALAARKGTAGKVGKFLQRPIQNPIQTATLGGAGKVRQLRSPLGAAPASSTPLAPSGKGGPYRSLGEVLGPKKSDVRHVKSKSLVRTLAPTAALLGTGYLAYKGIPAAARFAEQASSNPMAYNFGHQQFQYGYTPEGQAQF